MWMSYKMILNKIIAKDNRSDVFTRDSNKFNFVETVKRF